jgi:hypothetical protein
MGAFALLVSVRLTGRNTEVLSLENLVSQKAVAKLGRPLFKVNSRETHLFLTPTLTVLDRLRHTPTDKTQPPARTERREK